MAARCAAESTKSSVASTVTRSSTLSNSFPTRDIHDESLTGDAETKHLWILPTERKVESSQTAPQVNKNIHSAVPTIIGRSGNYQIFKLCAILPKQQVGIRPNRACKPSNSVGSDIKLGLSLERKEWMGRKLRNSFEKGPTSYTIVTDVKPGSIAELAGALKNDILVWCKGDEPIIFHHLYSGYKTVVWKLIDEAILKEKDLSRQLLFAGFFTFYVARPFNEETSSASEPSPAARLSTTHVYLSDDILARAQQFNSLTVEEKAKLLLDARDDAKKCFDFDRDKVIKSLPGVVKNAFCNIGFAEWGRIKPKTCNPVLVISPFSLSGASSVRRIWFEQYETVS